MLLVLMLVRHIVSAIGSSSCCQFVVLLVLLLVCHLLVCLVRCIVNGVGKCHVVNDVIGHCVITDGTTTKGVPIC
jgi:hypothetical protein